MVLLAREITSERSGRQNWMGGVETRDGTPCPMRAGMRGQGEMGI